MILDTSYAPRVASSEIIPAVFDQVLSASWRLSEFVLHTVDSVVDAVYSNKPRIKIVAVDAAL